jgi:hypothetical protein
MGIETRGRKSAAHIIELPVEHGRLRPEKLPPKERALWNEIVGAMPINHFGPENQHLLRMLCSHAITAEVVADKLAKARASGEDLKKVDLLSGIHARSSKAIADLSTKLKLTPRSKMSQEKASHQQRLASQVRPWETT